MRISECGFRNADFGFRVSSIDLFNLDSAEQKLGPARSIFNDTKSEIRIPKSEIVLSGSASVLRAVFVERALQFFTDRVSVAAFDLESLQHVDQLAILHQRY